MNEFQFFTSEFSKSQKTTQSVSSVSQSQIRLTFLTSRSHGDGARTDSIFLSSLSLVRRTFDTSNYPSQYTVYSREYAENSEKAMFNMLNE